MSLNFSAARPPDDSGSDTFARFSYQAHLALAYCLDCAFGGNIVSVVLEHFEDLALEYPDGRWRLIQVKTRDPGLGPWKLSDLLGDGGAIRSLHRSYLTLMQLPVVYEAHLEGAAKNGDPINDLRPPVGRPIPQKTVDVIADALEVRGSECVAFLTKALVIPGQPLRASVVSHNLLLLGTHAPRANQEQLRRVHEQIVAAIHEAMVADRLGGDWPRVILDPNADALRSRFERKQLTAAKLGALTRSLSPEPRHLLSRLVDLGPTPTVLEQKLLAGGATLAIVRHAQLLRAHASIKKTQYLAASLSPDEAVLEDLKLRLLIRVQGLSAEHSGEPQAAVRMWNQLLTDFQTLPSAYDWSGVLDQDPFLLLGEVCDLADECLVNWGVADA